MTANDVQAQFALDVDSKLLRRVADCLGAIGGETLAQFPQACDGDDFAPFKILSAQCAARR